MDDHRDGICESLSIQSPPIPSARWWTARLDDGEFASLIYREGYSPDRTYRDVYTLSRDDAPSRTFSSYRIFRCFEALLVLCKKHTSSS